MQSVSKLVPFSLSLLSFVAWIVISSMAFTNSAIFFVDVPITGMVVVGGMVGAKEEANVEGIVVETIGIIVCGVVVNSLCLD